MRNTILLSMILSKTSPSIHPTVIIPQNKPTVAAPSVSGLKPMIGPQEFRDPVCDSLFHSYIGKYPKEKKQDSSLFE